MGTATPGDGCRDRCGKKGWLAVGIIDYLDYIGIVAFAISGASTAIKKRMDYLGILIMAGVTAIGGGVIRDIIIRRDSLPIFFERYEYSLLILLTTAFVILTKGQIRWSFALDIFDALGLATFAIEAGITAISMELNFITFCFVSFITAVGGGIIRDLFAREIPHILRPREIYAVAAVGGSVCFWFLRQLIDLQVAAYICIALTFFTRLLCMRFRLALPTVKPPQARS